MAPSEEMPVIIAGDAAERIEALGIQRDVEAILRHTLHRFPGIRGIDVTPNFAVDNPLEPGLMVAIYKDLPESGEDPIEQEWQEWLERRFPHVASWFAVYVACPMDEAE